MHGLAVFGVVVVDNPRQPHIALPAFVAGVEIIAVVVDSNTVAEVAVDSNTVVAAAAAVAEDCSTACRVGMQHHSP